MGMTITQKILAAHTGLETVAAGDLIEASLDVVLGNDVTVPPAVKVFGDVGTGKVFDKTKICLIQDHFTPNKDIKSANAKIHEYMVPYGNINFEISSEMTVDIY